MKIVKVEIDIPWRFGDDAEAKKASDMAKLTGLLDKYRVSYDPEDIKTFVCTADTFACIAAGLAPYQYNEVTIKSVATLFDGTMEMREQMDAVLNRMNTAAARLEAQQACDLGAMQPDVPGWNGRTQSAISGPVLHAFNDLMLCENCCTDNLQNLLNDGWRMIAVCPQESRRPDYVLGRFATAPRTGSAHRG